MTQYPLSQFSNIDQINDYDAGQHGHIVITTLADLPDDLNLATYELVTLVEDNPSLFEDITSQTTPADLTKFFDQLNPEDLEQDDWTFLIEYFSQDAHKEIFLDRVQPTRYVLDHCGPDLVLKAQIDTHRFAYSPAIFPANCQTEALMDQYIRYIAESELTNNELNPFMAFDRMNYVFYTLLENNIDTDDIRGWLSDYDNICGLSNSSNSRLLYFKDELEEADADEYEEDGDDESGVAA